MRGPRSPADAIPGLAGSTLADFWRWAYGDLRENTVRPAFAEFIVGTLLGLESSSRPVWNAWDLDWRGARIEVKSAAYVQAWPASRRGRSPIQFDIARKIPWTADTAETGTRPVRSADCYVFCLYPEQDEARADPIDVPAWRFWVVPTHRIEQVFGGQAKVALSRIEQLTPAVDAAGLRAAVEEALGTAPS